ncbi:MAG: WD40 repeat domain-containing protein, partial [Ktedonobacteraceae bacterium]
IAWATDRKNVIASSGMSDGTVQVWDALIDHRIQIYHGDGRALALSWQVHTPWIVSGGTDTEIYTWNADTGRRGTSYSGHKGDVRTVAWLPPRQQTMNEISPATTPTATPAPSATPATPDSVILIASGGADGTVQIWNAATGEHIYTYTGHTAGVNGLALFYNGSSQATPTNLARIVSVSDDGTAQVWKPANQYPIVVYRGHRGKVNAVAALSSQIPYYGPRAASAGEDQTVQIWSIYQRKLLNTYSEHQAPVRAIASSPAQNDNRLVSGDADGLIHLWAVSGYSYQ